MFAEDADAETLQRLRVLPERVVGDREAGVRSVGRQRLGHRGERIARVVVARRRVLERVEHPGRIRERAGVNARAIVEPLIANAAVVGQQPLRGQQRRDAVAGRGALTRGARLLAYADRHQVGSHRYSGAATRSARHAFGVVRVARLAAPRAHRLLTGYQVGSGGGGATRIAGATVELVRSGLGIDDRPFRAQACHDGGVERWRIHGEVHIVVRRRPHVLRVVGILDGGDDAVHRQRREVRSGAVSRVELGAALEGIRLPAERLASGRRTWRERSGGRVRIERALARDRSFAADVQRFERVQLPGIRDPDPHAHLGADDRIGDGSVHAAVIKRQALVLIEVGQNRGSLHSPGREHERRAGSHVSRCRGDIGAVRGEQRRADTVIGLRAIDVSLHHALTGRLAGPNGRVDARDGGFLHLEGRSRLGPHASWADAPHANGRAHKREREAKRRKILHGR